MVEDDIAIFAVKRFDDHGIKLDRADLLSLSIVDQTHV